MITKQQALSANMFHDSSAVNGDGTCRRWRRNGATQTWKTRPTDFRVPVKHGHKSYDNITQDLAYKVHTREDCTNPKGKGN